MLSILPERASRLVAGVAVGVSVGIIAVGFLADLPSWSALVVLLPLFLSPMLLRSKLSRHFLALTLGVALGVLIAAQYGHAFVARKLPVACVKQLLSIRGQVVSLPVRGKSAVFGGSSQKFMLELSEPLPKECAGPRRLYVSYYGLSDIQPGQHWQFRAVLKRPWGLANRGSYNMQDWFAQRAVDAVGSVRGEGELELKTEDWRLQHHRWRHRLRERITQLHFSAETKAVLKALTIADKSAIERSLWLRFQALGVNHLLVVSGLHIGLVAGLGFLLGRAAALLLPRAIGAQTWLPGLLAVTAASGYTALAGFSLPTQRALVMLAMFALTHALGRPQSAAKHLLFAALVVLLVNPLAAIGSGFWLSFGAVAALLWLTNWLSKWQHERWFVFGAVRTHAYMALVMWPLGTWFFAGASVVAMFANVLLIPVIGLLVVPLALLAAFCHLLGWSIEILFWLGAGLTLEALLAGIAAVDRAAGAWFFQPAVGDLFVVCLALFGCLASVVPLRTSVRLTSIALLLPLLLWHPVEEQDEALTTSITVLDVGQGTAVVVRSGDKALLYDTGGGSPGNYVFADSVILPHFQERGIHALDTLVVSHSDLDHSAGAQAILQAVPSARIRYGGTGYNFRSGKNCVAGEAWRWPAGQRFQFLSPALEHPEKNNDSSCVLQIQIGEVRILLPGDIQRLRERELARYWRETLRSDWILAGHHGSKTSSAWSFLKQVQPLHGVVSAGYANRFGHPHPEVVERFSALSTAVTSTASGGALTYVVRPGQKTEVQQYRLFKKRYWM